MNRIWKKLQLLWKDTENQGDPSLAEPSEARFRTLVLAIAVLVGPPLLLLFYYKMMFPGLNNVDALDFAQLGRNMSSGRGFVTYVIRPLAATHGGNALGQPDVVHSPLYPFILALSFSALGAKDTIAAAVSGIFYLLTIPVVYRLGVRAFSRAVGLVTALIIAFNALLLEYAASGLHITLYIFLMTSLMLVMYHIAAYARDVRASQEKPESGGVADESIPLPRNSFIAAGVLTGLLYLTDPIFFWIIPFVLGTVFVLNQTRRVRALLLFCVPLAILILPWMARNAALTGNPFFGLRGLELWMNTKNHYPGYIGYRMTPRDLIPSVGLFKDIVQKTLFGAGQVIQHFPQVTASWVLAFFLPSLLFRFTDEAANTLRRILMTCFLGVLMGMLLFRPDQMPLFVSFIPTMMVFSVAFLLHLTQQAQLTRFAAFSVASLLGIAVVYPLMSDVALNPHIDKFKETAAAQVLKKQTPVGDVFFSDQPYIVAWYADRPSILMPAIDPRITEMQQKFKNARWLFLTDQISGYSPEWQYIYGNLVQWNNSCVQARDQNLPAPHSMTLAFPTGVRQLFDALNGFTTVAPAKDVNPSTVIAVMTPGARAASSAPTMPGPANADASSNGPKTETSTPDSPNG